MNIGGIPPAWNDTILALADFRDGKLQCFDVSKTEARIEEGFTPPSDRPTPVRWSSLAQAFQADGAQRWASDLGNPNRFEVLALALTPDRVVAVVQFQNQARAHPQWQLVAFNSQDGSPIWFWRHDLPAEPLPEGLAVGNQGQLLVTTLEGQVLSYAPQQPRAKGR